jgi:hypothetical protein
MEQRLFVIKRHRPTLRAILSSNIHHLKPYIYPQVHFFSCHFSTLYLRHLHEMDLPESANIRDLDPDDLRSADTVHPGSPKLPNSAEQSYLDDGVEDAIPFDVPTDSPPVDPLQETDASYGFEPQEPAEMPTPLPHKAVQRLVEQNGDMSPPIGSQPISADNGDLTPPLSDEIEPTRWVSQDELVNVNGVMTSEYNDDEVKMNVLRLIIRRCG